MSRVLKFDDDTGFDYAWDSMPSSDDRSYVIYSFVENGVQVARALVNTQPLRLIGYVAPPELLTTELDYFEVREDCQGRGVGKRVADALVVAHGQLYALSSPDAVGFYRAIGWTEFVHENGPSPSQAELFVSP